MALSNKNWVTYLVLASFVVPAMAADPAEKPEEQVKKKPSSIVEGVAKNLFWENLFQTTVVVVGGYAGLRYLQGEGDKALHENRHTFKRQFDQLQKYNPQWKASSAPINEAYKANDEQNRELLKTIPKQTPEERRLKEPYFRALDTEICGGYFANLVVKAKTHYNFPPKWIAKRFPKKNTPPTSSVPTERQNSETGFSYGKTDEEFEKLNHQEAQIHDQFVAYAQQVSDDVFMISGRRLAVPESSENLRQVTRWSANAFDSTRGRQQKREFERDLEFARQGILKSAKEQNRVLQEDGQYRPETTGEANFRRASAGVRYGGSLFFLQPKALIAAFFKLSPWIAAIALSSTQEFQKKSLQNQEDALNLKHQKDLEDWKNSVTFTFDEDTPTLNRWIFALEEVWIEYQKNNPAPILSASSFPLHIDEAEEGGLARMEMGKIKKEAFHSPASALPEEASGFQKVWIQLIAKMKSGEQKSAEESEKTETDDEKLITVYAKLWMDSETRKLIEELAARTESAIEGRGKKTKTQEKPESDDTLAAQRAFMVHLVWLQRLVLDKEFAHTQGNNPIGLNLDLVKLLVQRAQASVDATNKPQDFEKEFWVQILGVAKLKKEEINIPESEKEREVFFKNLEQEVRTQNGPLIEELAKEGNAVIFEMFPVAIEYFSKMKQSLEKTEGSKGAPTEKQEIPQELEQKK